MAESFSFGELEFDESKIRGDDDVSSDDFFFYSDHDEDDDIEDDFGSGGGGGGPRIALPPLHTLSLLAVLELIPPPPAVVGGANGPRGLAMPGSGAAAGAGGSMVGGAAAVAGPAVGGGGAGAGAGSAGSAGIGGGAPVVNWRAFSAEHLAVHPQYAGLPHPSKVRFAGPADVHRFRQGSWQAEAMHRGRITTRHLAVCLGLYEPSSAKELRVGAGSRGHMRVLAAFRHLTSTKPVTRNELEQHAAAGRRIVLAPRRADRVSQVWKITSKGRLVNEAYPLALNVAGGKAERGAWVIAWPSSKGAKNELWRRRKAGKGGGKSGKGGGKSGKGGKASVNSTWFESVLNTSMVLSSSSREPGSRIVLMPRGTGSKLLQQWVVEDDGRIRSAANADLVLDISDVAGATGDSLDTGPGAASGSGAAAAADADGVHWVPAAPGSSFTHDFVVPAGASSVAPSLGPEGEIAEVRAGWGSVQEDTALVSVMNTFRGARLEEVGLCPLEALPDLAALARSWGVKPQHLPLLGASPDGILAHDNGIREAVEVKCVCPFRAATAGTGGGICVRDAGPKRAGHFPCEHMPQVQCEMLCSGTRSCIYISLSATRGATIFRVSRDDAYLGNMLHLLQRFRAQYVLPKKAPPTNFFYGLPQHAQFRARTAELARSAPVLRTLQPHEVQRPDEPSSWFFVED